MPNKLMTRVLIATMTTSVVAVIGAGTGIAAAAPHPVSPATFTAGPHSGQPQQLWDSVRADGKTGDSAALKTHSLALLRALPHTYSANEAALASRARAQIAELPVPPIPSLPSPTKAVCDLIASLLATLGSLLNSVLGLPTAVPDVCSSLPDLPVPVPPLPT